MLRLALIFVRHFFFHEGSPSHPKVISQKKIESNILKMEHKNLINCNKVSK